MRYILKKLADARALLLGSIEYVYFVWVGFFFKIILRHKVPRVNIRPPVDCVEPTSPTTFRGGDNASYNFAMCNKHVWSSKIWLLGIQFNFKSYIGVSELSWFMVFNATFHNISVISWRSVLLVEETWVSGENPGLLQVADKFYHNVVSSIPRHERCSNSQL